MLCVSRVLKMVHGKVRVEVIERSYIPYIIYDIMWVGSDIRGYL